MRALLDLIRRFRSDSRGNMTFTFAIVMVPLLTAVGAATDYSMATRMRAKLQSAADAAAVASVSQQSPGYLAAAQMTADGSVTAGVTDANKIFNGIMATITGYTNLSETSTVTKTGVKLTSSVTFTAQVPTIFMKIAGFPTMAISGSSSASGALPTYLDFYLMLDVSGSMGLPSTDAEQTRLAAVNPDDFSTYSNGCTFACHFQAQNSCSDPSKGQKANAAGVYSPINQAYPTNNYCLGYLISRVGPGPWQTLLQSDSNYPMKGVSVLSAFLANANSNVTLGAPNSLLAGNSKSTSTKVGSQTISSLTAVTSCPTEGASNCIQLRADAVGMALNATIAANGIDGLFATANKAQLVPNQFRIGLYPFIRYLWTYYGLTSSINGSPTNSSTINYAAANLATLLDTGTTPNITNLGSGGTHFENAFPSMSTLITTVGNGSSQTNTKPFVFLVTDGAQDFQTCCGFSGSNSATVMPTGASSYCKPLKDRGITISVLYIPYAKIQNPTTVFNNEDGVANANIANIPASLQDCASSGFFFEADTPADITTALNKMFQQALSTAHITN
jgi:Flp pilus assembly protein TadG